MMDNNSFGDTALRLNCFSFGHSNNEPLEDSQRNSRSSNNFNFSDDGCCLILGLGPPSVYYENHSKIKLNQNQQKSLLSESDPILQLGLWREAEECSILTQTDCNAVCLLNGTTNDNGKLLASVHDEGSTSAKKSGGGYMPSLLLAPRIGICKSVLPSEAPIDLGPLSPQPSATTTTTTDFSFGTVSEPSSSYTKTTHFKKCNFSGCEKGARGASGHCIGHGGGQRCIKPGCNKGAESRTAFCKAHGGGRRCEYLGCTKSAEGKTDHCIAHGGGKRCTHPSICEKAARGKSGLCIKHGGGKRCKIENCTRSAEGQIGLCISHGGGRRCQFPECSKGAQGSTMYCKAHGGGKRCVFAGCMKGAEGSTPLCKGHGGGRRCLFDGGAICPKSVHGGTDFCVSHGGGKRCIVPECTKSARGRTDCCVKHGGGKRCHVANCGKSAQGCTDFCKAHGGGKRCSWDEDGKCEKFARGKNGLCAAHSSLVDKKHGGDGLIGPGLFKGLVVLKGSGSNSSSGISAVSDCRNERLIPNQVLVPLSMKCSPSKLGGEKKMDFVIPEGRVHGGGLMSLFGGNLNNAVD